MPSFNPCCGGLQSSTDEPLRAQAESAAVSILVVVDCSRQRQRRGPRERHARVSILVVVDCSRQRAAVGRSDDSSVSILVVVDCSRQHDVLCHAWRTGWFQSLLWWIAVVNQRDVRLQTGVNILFQSLLWWIAVVNQPCTGEATLSREVSILVVVDCSRQRPSLDNYRRGQRRVSILVVVDCSRQLDRHGGRRSRQPGFNPCCGGLQSSTRCPTGGSRCRPGCFNPCCGGLQSSTRRAPRPGQGSGRVSILVVVDCSRQPTASNMSDSVAIRFQSLLWWIAVVNRDRQWRSRSAASSFQSLLWWIAVVNMPDDDSDSSHGWFQSLLWWIAVVNRHDHV